MFNKFINKVLDLKENKIESCIKYLFLFRNNGRTSRKNMSSEEFYKKKLLSLLVNTIPTFLDIQRIDDLYEKIKNS